METNEEYEKILATNKALGESIDNLIAKNLDLKKENKELREKIDTQTLEKLEWITAALDDAKAPLLHYLDGEELNTRGRIMGLRRLLDHANSLVEGLYNRNLALLREIDEANKEKEKLAAELADKMKITNKHIQELALELRLDQLKMNEEYHRLLCAKRQTEIQGNYPNIV